MEQSRQVKRVMASGRGSVKGRELVIRDPKLMLMDQVREVLRVKHYAIQHPASNNESESEGSAKNAGCKR
jgi:hypothetical protein